MSLRDIISLLRSLPNSWYYELDNDDGSIILLPPNLNDFRGTWEFHFLEDDTPGLLIQVSLHFSKELDDLQVSLEDSFMDLGWAIPTQDELEAGKSRIIDCRIENAENVMRSINIIVWHTSAEDCLDEINRISTSISNQRAN